MFPVQEELANYANRVESRLAALVPDADPETAIISDAMRYSLLGGGKRIRPYLTCAFARIAGGDPGTALDFGCALEMVHAYSLIHDDLPAMDNDTVRRGKPTCHVAYGEAIAILAGDALLTRAFAVLAETDVPDKAARLATAELADAAGYAGMVGGQTLDMTAEGKSVTEETLIKLQELKTGALIRAACRLGCLSGGVADGELFAAADLYAEKIGLAFQVIDDLLDGVGDPALLGKSVGKDAESGKTTWLSLLGEEGARAYATRLTDQAIAAVAPYDRDGRLAALATLLLERNK
ncbi:MAG: polyprenyl synthetase family protein [Clostridia bacterium]|nr:polyprenyl synthetase family protein [Clostridia bacterium]